MAFVAFNVFILILNIYVYIKLIITSFKDIYMSLLYVIGGIWILISLIVIEAGVYMSETDSTGYPIFSLIYYSIISLTGITTVFFFNRYIDSRIKIQLIRFTNEKSDKRILLVIFIFVFILLAINQLLSPSPNSGEFSRIDYWANSKFPILKTLFGNVASFLPFIAGIFFLTRKKVAIIMMLLYCAYMVGMGQKFGPFWLGTYFFFMPMVLTSNIKVSLSQIFKFKYLFYFAIIYGIIYISYSINNPYSDVESVGDNVNLVILYRAFALQSQLIWLSLEKYVHLNQGVSWQITDLSYGMQKLMREFGAGIYIEESIDRGGNFTNGYPSILFTVFPFYITILINILLMIVYVGFMGNLLKTFLINKNYLFAVFTFQVFAWSIDIFTNGIFIRAYIPIIFMFFILILNLTFHKSKSYL